MRYPIPPDWDGTSWQCYQIQWPDSIHWLALLQGILTALERGRTWAEGTGSVIDAQAMGRQVVDRNFPLLNCVGECVCETPAAHAGSGDFSEEEYEDMPCLNLSDRMEFRDDGHLWVYDECCCLWVDLGSIKQAAVESVPDDPLNPDHDPAVTYYACGKATAGVDLIWLVASNVWDVRDNPPTGWISDIESDSKINGDNLALYNAVLVALNMSGVGYTRDDVINESDKAWAKAQLAVALADDAEPATRDQWVAFRHNIESHWGIDIFKRNFWNNVIWGAGYKNFKNATALGALDPGDGCDLPPAGIDDPTPSWGTEWGKFIDFTKTQEDSVTPNSSIYTAGLGWHKEDTDTGYQDIQVNIPFVTAQDASYITRAWVRFRLPASMSYIQTEFTLARSYQSQAILTQANVGDSDPSIGGVIIAQGVVNTQCNAATSPIKLRIEGDVTIPASQVAYLEAIAFGGTGVSPFI